MLALRRLSNRTWLFSIVLLLLATIILSSNGQSNDEIYENIITITDVSGNGLENYPFQFGRPFLKGHVLDTPGVKFNGNPIDAQVQVTNRFEDGSVKFAIISTLLPKVPLNGVSYVKFFNSKNVDTSTSSCSIERLLGDLPELDVSMLFTSPTNGKQVNVNLREMIKKKLYEFRTNGPIRCELIIADHSVARSTDFGKDFTTDTTCNPFRPIFHISHWPGIKSARVRIVLESSNSDCLQDTYYHVSISTGVSTKTEIHSQKDIPHLFGSRWTKTMWFGTTPETKVNIKFNIDYLSMTRYIPNYSGNDTASEGQLNYYYSTLLNSKYSNIFESGKLSPYMPTTGMREEIGVMPQWSGLWLTHGDWRMREMSIIHADLAGGWRGNFREANPNLFFDRNHSVPGFGKPMSINGHPDLWFPDNNGIFANLGNPVKTTPSGWVYDNSHQPDPNSVVYMLTGDYYYYESLVFWACHSVLSMQASIYGRGIAGWAGVQEQVRGIAWLMRTRTYAAIYSPDNTPEQRYLNDCIDDAIAQFEGQRGIDDPNYRNRTNYIWAAKNIAFDWSPLRFFTKGGGRVSAIWQEAFLTITFGIMRDLGYKVEPILREYSKLFTTQIGAPNYDPRYNAYYWLSHNILMEHFTAHGLNLKHKMIWNNWKAHLELLLVGII